ncbi:MAG: hypothetical protein AAGC60_06260 [Acidobacteriota bacterium]
MGEETTRRRTERAGRAGRRRRANLALVALCLLVATPLLGLTADWRAACASECCPLEGPSCCCKRPVWRGADGSPYRPPAVSRTLAKGGIGDCRGLGGVLVSSLESAPTRLVVGRAPAPVSGPRADARTVAPRTDELPAPLLPRPPPR